MITSCNESKGPMSDGDFSTGGAFAGESRWDTTTGTESYESISVQKKNATYTGVSLMIGHEKLP